MGFFPTLCIYRQKRRGGTGWKEDPPLSEGFCPSVPAAVTLGELYVHIHTHGSPGVHSFHLEGRVKVGG